MRSSNIPGSYIFLLFFSQFGLYAILVRFSSIIAQLLKNIRTAFVLNDNTHHSAPAVVDNFLHGILEFCLAVLGDLGDFAADAVVNELLDGFAENVGIPDSLRALCALFDIGDQILRLLLTSDDRRFPDGSRLAPPAESPPSPESRRRSRIRAPHESRPLPCGTLPAVPTARGSSAPDHTRL